MRGGDAKPRRAARSIQTPIAKECAGSARARSPAKRGPTTVKARFDRLERLRGKRFDRVNAGGVPQHEASDVLEPRGLDLVLDVSQRVGPTEGKVLQPRDEHRLAPA